MSDPEIPGKRLILLLGLAMAVVSFGFGVVLTLAFIGKTPFWAAGLHGTVAALAALSFVVWVRKLP